MKPISVFIAIVLLLFVYHAPAQDLRGEAESTQQQEQAELNNAKSIIRSMDVFVRCNHLVGRLFIKKNELYMNSIDFTIATKGDFNSRTLSAAARESEQLKLTKLTAIHDRSNNSYRWTIRTFTEQDHGETTFQLYMDELKLFLKHDDLNNHQSNVVSVDCTYVTRPSTQQAPTSPRLAAEIAASAEVEIADKKKRREAGDYGARLRACIIRGVAFPAPPRSTNTNPSVQYRVSLTGDGKITDITLIKSSGNNRFDQAVETGIKGCSPFPKPQTNKYPNQIELTYNMYD